jgi:hypothetical protein
MSDALVTIAAQRIAITCDPPARLTIESVKEPIPEYDEVTADVTLEANVLRAA